MAVSTHFEWMRIGLAIGLMTLAFVVLPVFFLWHDKRVSERAAFRQPDDTSSG
ncbi:MAG TPA: hypothetical protein VHX15_08810 [Frankiaceae bacterium]|jgi:hypothetical protein|nr:hypothetical protein [Frankiaceae bacterium]